uniref:hypothetical protein n=1 Tax=Ruegeria arenilitoris TaxID=1173585 RepID=UPI00147C47C8|nr:hypothetical protein [Ruegeria arenilitoris]
MHLSSFSTPGAFVAALNLDLIAAAAARRQANGRGDGDRPAPSLAAAPVDLVEISDRDHRAPATERGQKTARRRAPAFLSRYSEHDGRRLAAMRYLAAVERLDRMGGAALSIEAVVAAGSGSGGVSDGGVTSRVEDVAFLRLVHGTVNRWKWDLGRRCFVRGPARVVLAPRRGKARDAITAIDLLNGILIDGLSMAEILRRAGWSVQSKHRDKLTDAAEEMLDQIADKLGLSARIHRS